MTEKWQTPLVTQVIQKFTEANEATLVLRESLVSNVNVMVKKHR